MDGKSASNIAWPFAYPESGYQVHIVDATNSPYRKADSLFPCTNGLVVGNPWPPADGHGRFRP
jgi:hypothetical protein